MRSGQGKSIELFFFDAGGGHRSAATALRIQLADYYPDWTVTLVNLQDLLQAVDPVHRISTLQSQDIYNGLLKRGWTFGSRAMLRGLQKGIWLLSPVLESCLRDHWKKSGPDLVVSVIPNFNGVMYRALCAVHPGVPYVTVMTDLADCPPRFWHEPQDQYMICGTNKAIKQARAVGYDANKLFRVSGMVLNPKFYRHVEGATALTRESIGLDAGLLTAVITFGGYSSSKVKVLVDRLLRSRLPLQAIVLCGHNEKLLEALAGRERCHAVGFTTDVPAYMRIADFFIGKPGPGSLSEALHMGLPVLVERNSRTLPQEGYNTVWIEEQGLGIAVRSFRNLVPAVEQLIQEDNWRDWRESLQSLNNVAIYEISQILGEIVGSPALSPCTGGTDLPSLQTLMRRGAEIDGKKTGDWISRRAAPPEVPAIARRPNLGELSRRTPRANRPVEAAEREAAD